MKTNNPFIAAACDQAGEVCELLPLSPAWCASVDAELAATAEADEGDKYAISFLADALEMFVGGNALHSLCRHEGMDPMGRVKGTWSAAAEANARATLNITAHAVGKARAVVDGKSPTLPAAAAVAEGLERDGDALEQAS